MPGRIRAASRSLASALLPFIVVAPVAAQQQAEDVLDEAKDAYDDEETLADRNFVPELF